MMCQLRCLIDTISRFRVCPFDMRLLNDSVIRKDIKKHKRYFTSRINRIASLKSLKLKTEKQYCCRPPGRDSRAISYTAMCLH